LMLSQGKSILTLTWLSYFSLTLSSSIWILVWLSDVAIAATTFALLRIVRALYVLSFLHEVVIYICLIVFSDYTLKSVCRSSFLKKESLTS
jgi:hypothetical protein